MKNVIILSFLLFILSCTDDDDSSDIIRFNTLENSQVTLSIDHVDGLSVASCPEIENSTFMIQDNSLVSGVLGQFGVLADSNDNAVTVFNCIQSEENENFMMQRFGGVLQTLDGEIITLEGRLEIDRSKHEVTGEIYISRTKRNDPGNTVYRVFGNIDQLGSCRITSRAS